METCGGYEPAYAELRYESKRRDRDMAPEIESQELPFGDPETDSPSEVAALVPRIGLALVRLSGQDLVDAINALRAKIHEHSPFKGEPVDFVRWERADSVHANDYNPNNVAPVEMELLRHSIAEDGYTQPIVSWGDGDGFEVVDGFHRHRVGKECKDVRERVRGYLPLVVINSERGDRNDRIASTIRHNRARGKHQIEAMSDIVVELKRRNWSDARICRELGMDQDEVLRLCQITGLTELFEDEQFSRSWTVSGSIEESDFEDLTDDDPGIEELDVTVQNTSDPDRIFHTHDKWECFKAGFYSGSVKSKTKAQCEQEYAAFLSDDDAFRRGLDTVTSEWRHSCEHYLTNASMNRIAWLGQAAACSEVGLPSAFRSGFGLMTEAQQRRANETALEYLNAWLQGREMDEVDMDGAMAGQHDIY